MELPDEEKRKALLAAQGVKGTLDVDTLPATSETIEQMQTGSPRTPGFDEHSGKTMKKPAEYDFESGGDGMADVFEEALSRITGAGIEAAPERQEEQTQATPANSNAFEARLAEMLQEATPAASPDKSRDIDR